MKLSIAQQIMLAIVDLHGNATAKQIAKQTKLTGTQVSSSLWVIKKDGLIYYDGFRRYSLTDKGRLLMDPILEKWAKLNHPPTAEEVHKPEEEKPRGGASMEVIHYQSEDTWKDKYDSLLQEYFKLANNIANGKQTVR